MKSLFFILWLSRACSAFAICIAVLNLVWVTMYHPPVEKFIVMGMTAPAAIAVSLNSTAIFLIGQLLQIVLTKFGPK